MALLEVENLQTHFRTPDGIIRAVDGVSFAVGRGETVAIVGESGSGKSVTANSILRLIPEPPGRIAGRIRFEGEDLLALSERAMRGIRGNRISMVFQEPMTSLNPVLTVGGQISEPLRLHQRLGRKEIAERAVEMLSLVGIAEPHRRAAEYPHQLSGGMRQRAAILRAFLSDSQILLMDEPFGSLDSQTRLVMQEELLHIWKEHRRTVIYVTHDIEEAIVLGDQVIVLSGRPGTVRRIIPIDLKRPRRISDRKHPDVAEMRLQIWRMLEDEVRRGLGVLQT